MTTKLDKMISELRDQYGIDNQASIMKLEDWETRISDINAELDNVHKERVTRIEAFTDTLKRELSEAHITTQNELRRMGEQIRDLRQSLRGEDTVVALDEKRKGNDK